MSAAPKAAERDALERLQRDVRKHARDESVEIDAARGWRVTFTERKTGAQAGTFYKEFYAPDGTRFRSAKEVCAHVQQIRGMKRKALKASAGSGKEKGSGKGDGKAKRGRPSASAETENEADALEKLYAYVKNTAGRDIRHHGWGVVFVERKSGALAGQVYKDYLTPCGNKVRSMKEVMVYLAGVKSPQSKKKIRRDDGSVEEEMEAEPTEAELQALEMKITEEHAAAITRAVPALPARTQSVQVTGLELDDDMDEDRLLVEFSNITGLEPVYETLEELREMVNKERARAAAKNEAMEFNFKPPTTRAPRPSLEALPNGLSYAAKEVDETKKADQLALIQRFQKESKIMNKLGDASKADWRGEARVPKVLGDTSVPDVVRGGTRAGATPMIAGTAAEIKLLPSTTEIDYDGAEDRPPFDPTDTSSVTTLKAAMHTSTAPDEVRCREDERAKVIDLIQGCLRDHKPGSLYLAGLPGTGKTLTLKDVQRTTERWGIVGKTRPRVAFINCMSVHNAKDIFGVVLDQLGERVASEDRAPSVGSIEYSNIPEVVALRRVVTSMNGGMCIILLDEMDQLETRDQEVLYELFALPALKGSRCVLAGVSNAINLTDRVLPRLRARGCEPALVTFSAYDAKQLKVLLKQRLAALPFKAFEDSALELCSRKVGAATGDMRKALNVCATAVDICVQEATKISEDGSEAPASAKGTVKISHMARALSKTYASPVVDSIRALPQMQQMVLCSAIKLLSSTHAMETTLGALHDRYVITCKTAGVKDLSQGEFHNMCSALSDHCLVKIGNASNDRLRKLRLLATRDDVEFSLQGVNFFRNLLGINE